jgi:hypothetical protein
MKIVTMFRFPLISLLIGVIANILGAYFRIIHHSYSDAFLLTGSFFEIMAALSAIIILSRQKHPQ